MEMLMSLPYVIGFMVNNGLQHHPRYWESLRALNEGHITHWEFVCSCQYIVDEATIVKLRK